MKRIITTFLLILSLAAFSQNHYFVSSSTGSNANPGTREKPFGGYFRAAQLAVPGDTISLKRGDFFPENNYFNRNRIYTNSYGEGDLPTFSGFVTPNTWTNEGDGVWSTYDPGFPANLFVLAIDGQYYAKGRTEGYRTFQKHRGTTWTAPIIDTSLSNVATDFTGYQVVIRKRGWVLDVGTITKHNGDTVNYGNNTGDQGNTYEPMNNYGYWFQNGRKCLNKFGDWMYDASQKKVYVKLDDKTPAAYKIQIAKQTRCFNLDGEGNVFDGIRITGYNQWGVIDGAAFANNTFINCEFSFCGQYAIYADDAPGLKVINCRFMNNPNNAVTGLKNTMGCHGWSIEGSYFYNTGMWPGMGKSGDVAYEAIAVEGDDPVIRNNRVIRTGYNPIYFKGSGALVESNLVDTAVVVKSDGGGVYTFQRDVITNARRRIIRGNTIRNILGAPDGVAPADVDAGKGFSVYPDEHAADIDIVGNLLSGASTANIFLHNVHRINIDSNILEGAPVGLRIRTYDMVSPTTAVSITRNKVVTAAGKLAVKVDTDTDSPVFGSLSGNRYITPETESKIFNIKQGRGTTYKNVLLSFTSWKSSIGGDALSLVATADDGFTQPPPPPPTDPVPVPSYLFKVITPDGKTWGYDGALKLFSEVKQ